MNNSALKLVYDIESCPKGLDANNMIRLYQQHNVVFFDSTKGSRPRLYAVDNEVLPAIVDTKGDELDLEYYSKMFRDKEYWEKELHNCTNSPIYYWKHYGTNVWPHTDEDMSKFMSSIGMDKITAADNEEAAKLWEEQKGKMKEALKFITVDHLKERKAHIDILKKEYNEFVINMEKKLQPFVRLVDSNEIALDNKKQCSNLIQKIKSTRPVLAKYSDKYRNPKGKWDLKMLGVTDYKVLLQIFHDICEDQNRFKDVLDSQPA